MAEIVTPPWDLCGFARDFDPYSLDPSPWYRTRRGALDTEPPPDPNEQDGRWGELAFMPHEVERVPIGVIASSFAGRRDVYRSRWATVPSYSTVAEALELGRGNI